MTKVVANSKCWQYVTVITQKPRYDNFNTYTSLWNCGHHGFTKQYIFSSLIIIGFIKQFI